MVTSNTDDNEEMVPDGGSENSVDQNQVAELPPFLEDECPTGKVDSIKWQLLHGALEEELVADGENATSVRLAALELEQSGYRKRPAKRQRQTVMPSPGTEVSEKTTTVTEKKIRAGSGQSQMKVYAKGAPAEVIIEQMRLPEEMQDKPGMLEFMMGTKFGMNLFAASVRVVQDLAAGSVNLVRPMIDAAKDMRAEASQAAKEAAGEAAEVAADNAANQVMGQVAPYLTKLEELLKKTQEAEVKEPIQEANEMKVMMMSAMKPIMKQLTDKIGSALTGVPGGGSDLNKLPDSWKVE